MHTGFSALINLKSGMLDIITSVPCQFRDQTRGLLGVYNDDRADDLTTPLGDVIDNNATERTIFYNFGELCKSYVERAFFKLKWDFVG